MKSFKEFMLIAENILSEEDLRAKAEEVAREARRRRAEQIRQRATNPGTDLRSEAERVADQARQRRVSSQTPRPGLRTRLAGTGTVASGLYDFATRKSEGQSTARAAGGAVSSALGYTKGAALGAKLGAQIPGPAPVKAGGAFVGGLVGGLGGSELASKAYNVIPQGPTQKDVESKWQKVGMRRSRQVAAQAGTYGARKGSAITGVGGPMKVNQKAGTITTGGKTAQLGKTQLIRDPKTGRQVVGDLAYRGGKPVYLARASTASRDTYGTPGGVWRNLQRRLNIGGQRERDVAAANKEYRTALASTQKYTKQLGVTPQSATRQKLPGYGKK